MLAAVFRELPRIWAESPSLSPVQTPQMVSHRRIDTVIEVKCMRVNSEFLRRYFIVKVRTGLVPKLIMSRDLEGFTRQPPKPKFNLNINLSVININL
jgi:hypothetical protein